MYYKIHNSFNKVCALVAATLILPALAYHDRKGDKDERNDHGNKHMPVVPEANAGWVLIPFFGAVLLFRGDSCALRRDLRPTGYPFPTKSVVPIGSDPRQFGIALPEAS
jgi:hypothetical protein